MGIRICPLTISKVTLMLLPMERALGIILDAFLFVGVQVTTIARTAFYHFWLIGLLVPYLSTCNLATVIQAMVIGLL